MAPQNDCTDGSAAWNGTSNHSAYFAHALRPRTDWLSVQSVENQLRRLMAPEVDESVSGDYAPVSVSDELHLELLPFAWHTIARNEQLTKMFWGFHGRQLAIIKWWIQERTS